MGRSNTTQTTTQQLDPWTQARRNDLWTMGQDAMQPYQAFPGGSRVAGASPMQLQAQDFLQGTMGTGIAEAQQAAGIAGGIAQGGATPMVAPSMLAAPTVADPMGVSAERVQGGNLMQGIGMYQDPFESQVVNAAMSDIDRSRQMATQGVRSAATQAGAFGGDRAAILEAETNRGFADVAARTAAQLRSQGFSQAANLAQSDAMRGLQAGGMNQSAGLQAALANQGAGLQTGLANAQFGLNAGLANQSAGLQGQLANQGAFFQGRGQQLQGAGLLSQLGGDMFNRNMGTLGALSQMGDRQQNQAQAELSDQVGQFYEERDFPWEQLARMQGLFGGMPFGQTMMSTQPRNRGAGVAGGALSGASAGAAFGPWGAGIGAIGGGLLGML